jgi:hypothetical protein
MAFDSKGLDDYVDVAARIVEFRAELNRRPAHA